jgi:arsenite-transporting ATPase
MPAVAKLDFFVGKGGVGKTTVSAAYALHHAVHHPAESILLLSTDPAHSLSDIWQQPLGDAAEKARLRRPGHLHLWQVNAEKKFRGFLDKHKEAMLSILEKGSIFSRQDIEPLLNTTLPGMAEMSALLAMDDALRDGKYDRIVVDTAPFGHTLRLFELPQYFSRFLDFLELATDRDRVLAAHFGGHQLQPNNPILSEWRLLVEAVQKAFLVDAKLFLVTTAESFSLNEAVRCSTELRTHSPPIEINAVVLNRVVRGQNKCTTCQKNREMTRAGRAFLKKIFPSQQLYLGEDSGAPIVGLMGLEHFGRHVFAGKPFRWKPLAPNTKKLQIVRTDWPVLGPLSLVLGKGGVGKTTISAALGFHARAQEKVPVEICSVDPAPSLDDIFQTNVTGEAKSVLGDPKFRASELDSTRIFRDWVSTIKHSIDQAMTSTRSSVHVDLSFERQLFATLLDSVPPGLDEILAVVRISDLLSDRSKRVVIDMAPTGHALDLLRTPERILAWTRALLKTLSAHRTLDLARDAGVNVAQLGKDIRDLLSLLKNSQQTCIYTVMLAEPLPDRETERLMNELHNLKMNAACLFVNRLLFPDDVRGCRRCGRASRWQMATLANLLRNHAELSVYLVRNFPSEIAGKKALRSLTGELWRVA